MKAGCGSSVYKITYQGKEFFGESMEEVVREVKAYEKLVLSNALQNIDNPAGTYRYDNEYDSIEIYFQMKPAKSTLELLSSNGWKWHRAKKCWYSKRNPLNIQFAENICIANEKNPEQLRQKAILAVRNHCCWKKEYLHCTLEELLELPQKLEREYLWSRISSDFLRHHGITIPQNCDEEQLKLFGDKCVEFKQQCSQIELEVTEGERQLFKAVYQYQLDLYESEIVNKDIEKAYEERENRKRLQQTLQEGDTLCPVCYTVYSSVDVTCPECKRLKGLQPILKRISLKESSFWESLQLYGGNLQPIDVARRLNSSPILGRWTQGSYYLTPSLSPKFEKLAWAQIKSMPIPDVSFDMDRKEFVWALSILSCQKKEWKQLCRQYCLLHSKSP